MNVVAAARASPTPASAEAGTLDQAELGQRYAVEFDLDSVPRLCEEHGLTLPLRS